MVITKRLNFPLPAAYSAFHRFFHFKCKSGKTTIHSPLKFVDYRDLNFLESTKLQDFTGTTGIDAYARLLDAYTRSKSLKGGEEIHRRIEKHNAHSTNAFLLQKIVCMYIACGAIISARRVFDEIQRPSVFLWNSLIRAYAWEGPCDQAIELYHRMLDLGVKPNKFTFPFVLKACSGLLALEEGREIHNHAKRVGLDLDLFVSTALVDLYMKCGCLYEAYEVFDRIPDRDVVAWNTMIAGLSLHGIFANANQLVFDMQKEGIRPNSSTIVAVLPAVGQGKALNKGKSMHGYCIRRWFDKDVLVGTAVLDMYAKCKQLNSARRTFDIMNIRNEVTWSAMIGAYVLCDQMMEALESFRCMMLEEFMNPTSATLGSVLRACANLNDLNRGKWLHGYSIKSGLVVDITVGNSLLSMYAKSGVVDYAIRFFDEIESKDTVSYSAIISGCVQNGSAGNALRIFRSMQASGVKPDLATMVGVIPACAHLAALRHGQCNHGFVTVCGFQVETSICNALIDMYSKCAKINIARQIFDRMPEQDVVSWNALIAGYGIHGLGREAFELFRDLQNTNLKPDSVTFISLLTACSHSGLVTEGKHLFHLMISHFSIIPRMEHFICMVDIFGRGGLLDEAHDFIKKMPMHPDVQIWGALLSACRTHGNIELGEEVSREILKLGPEDTGNFVLLSNIYSAAGKWVDAANVRTTQRDQGFRKSPGCSWIEIAGTMHAFIGGDQSHPQSTNIYAKLEKLLGEMKKLGYIPDTRFVLQDVEGEEKERILLYHSEKLAIAFGDLNLSPYKPILITKNLRVCGDCHTAIKFISTITERTITVRDASRYHHFKDGVCSCRDFWLGLYFMEVYGRPVVMTRQNEAEARHYLGLANPSTLNKWHNKFPFKRGFDDWMCIVLYWLTHHLCGLNLYRLHFSEDLVGIWEKLRNLVSIFLELVRGTSDSETD